MRKLPHLLKSSTPDVNGKRNEGRSHCSGNIYMFLWHYVALYGLSCPYSCFQVRDGVLFPYPNDFIFYQFSLQVSGIWWDVTLINGARYWSLSCCKFCHWHWWDVALLIILKWWCSRYFILAGLSRVVNNNWSIKAIALMRCSID